MARKRDAGEIVTIEAVRRVLGEFRKRDPNAMLASSLALLDIALRPGRPVTQVCDALFRSRSAIGDIVRKWEEDGLAKSTRNPLDDREKLLELTSGGDLVVDGIINHLKGVSRRVEDISP